MLSQHGVTTTCVSSANCPTGQVLVELDEAGRPTFEIATDTAWDHLEWSDALGDLAARTDAICFGTLAQRSITSRETIRRFLKSTRPECVRILDINLRSPFWSDDVVRESLELANVLKLNDTELAILADIWGWQATDRELLTRILGKYSLRLIAFTRGANGAMLIDASDACSDRPGEPTKIVDTVGAGDAFTAAMAIGFLRGMPLDSINAWASRVAAFVCSSAGATPRFPTELMRDRS